MPTKKTVTKVVDYKKDALNRLIEASKRRSAELSWLIEYYVALEATAVEPAEQGKIALNRRQAEDQRVKEEDFLVFAEAQLI